MLAIELKKSVFFPIVTQPRGYVIEPTRPRSRPPCPFDHFHKVRSRFKLIFLRLKSADDFVEFSREFFREDTEIRRHLFRVDKTFTTD